MGLFDTLKKKKEDMENKYYADRERSLLKQVEKAEIQKARSDRLNALKSRLNTLQPKSKPSGGLGGVWAGANAFFQHAGSVSLLGTPEPEKHTSKKKKHKEPQPTLLGIKFREL